MQSRSRAHYYDNLSSKAKSKLGELLLTIADEELLIEIKRQSLANIKDFEPYAAFTRLDREAKGFITGLDICTFIK